MAEQTEKRETGWPRWAKWSAIVAGLFLCVLVLAVVLIVEVASDPEKEALNEEDRIHQEIQNQAEAGDAHAQDIVGGWYELSIVRALDYAEAVKWYRLAADQGYAVAQFHLGRMYAEGKGVDQDRAQAAMWFRMAADQGYVDAKQRLKLLESGQN